MIPVFVIIFYLPFSWHYLAACVIFILAAITDGLDGYYARKLGQTSALGAFLDPVADKLMIAVVLVLLVEDDPDNWSFWLALPAAVIIGREITISALREWMAELGASSKVAVSGYGKLKTICQMVALGFLIYHNDLFGIPIYAIGMVLLYIASILTLWSMFLYLQAAWPQLKDSN
jgi:CDP-diacylglycerol--glycerol-3-phosphate 3-phosphatidyltransferase/cardiolipin synthase